jgi:hypothetical protein
VDELTFADIDADMAESAAHGVEEHEVAGLELAGVDLLGGGGLLFGAAREHVTDRLVVHGADEAAAIETRFGGVAATAIGDAQETDGGHHQVGCALCDGLANLLELPDDAFVGQHSCQLVIGLFLLRGRMNSDGK